jgi:queuine/archaeosine tRNA-ribosyltransferase
MGEARSAIAEGRFEAFRARFGEERSRGEPEDLSGGG